LAVMPMNAIGQQREMPNAITRRNAPIAPGKPPP
jgi:hypothetical protein